MTIGRPSSPWVMGTILRLKILSKSSWNNLFWLKTLFWCWGSIRIWNDLLQKIQNFQWKSLLCNYFLYFFVLLQQPILADPISFWRRPSWGEHSFSCYHFWNTGLLRPRLEDCFLSGAMRFIQFREFRILLPLLWHALSSMVLYPVTHSIQVSWERAGKENISHFNVGGGFKV